MLALLYYALSKANNGHIAESRGNLVIVAAGAVITAAAVPRELSNNVSAIRKMSNTVAKKVSNIAVVVAKINTLIK